MIDDSVRSGASVRSLIDRFELMARANASTAAAPKSAPDSSAVKEIVGKINSQSARARAQSEPVQMEKVEEDLDEEEEALPTDMTPLKKYQTLTVKTLESDDDDMMYVESDAESTSTMRSTDCCYSLVPRSPSAYSTTSTGSLDSLLNSLDIFLPELLQATGEASSEITKIAKTAVRPTRRSSLPEDTRPIASKLVPPASYRRASIASRSPVVPTTPAASKPRRSSLYASTAAPSAIPRPRRSSLSATSVPAVKSSRRFSESARSSPPIVVTSPRVSTTRSRSDSSPVARYMDYDHSPRFAATKAMNIERRRQLEERNRTLAADKVKQAKPARRPRTPQWQDNLDQVRSRLFDFQDDPQWSSTAKETASRVTKSSVRSRRSSCSSRVRV